MADRFSPESAARGTRLSEGSARPEGGRGAPALGGGAGAARAVGPGGGNDVRLRPNIGGAAA